MSALTGLALAACGATGVALLVDPLIGSPISRSLRVEPAALGAAARQRLNQAGLADVSITQLVAMSATAAVGAAVLTLVTLGRSFRRSQWVCWVRSCLWGSFDVDVAASSRRPGRPGLR